MAKRAPVDEQPYRPLLDPALVTSAMARASSAPATQREGDPALTVVRPVAAPKGPAIEPKSASEPVEVQNRPVPSSAPVAEKFDQEKRILFTRSETQALDRLVTSFATRVNAQVKVSHVVRALVTLLLNAEGELDKRAGELAILVRPPNGDTRAIQRFEQTIAGVIGAALRDAGPLRGG